MKSILLVLGSRPYREPLLDALAPIYSGEGASLHVVTLSGSGTSVPDDARERSRWLRGAEAASVDVLPWSEPAAVVERARALGVDLIAVAPELPPESTSALWLDPSVVRIASGAEQAVLVFRGAGGWPPRKAMLPLDGSTSAADALARALEALDALFGSSTRSPELHVLQAAPDTEAWYEMRGSLENEIALLPTDRRVHLLSCTRYGTPSGRRILARVAQEAPDLLVLERGQAQPAETHPAWLHVMSGARCSLLLLPGGLAPVEPPRKRGGSLWRQVSNLWPAGRASELPASA